MRTDRLSRLLPFALLLSLTACMYDPADHGEAVDPGFVEAYFDEATLLKLMKDKECAMLLFYTIRRSADDRSGSVMLMSADEDGHELYSYFAGPWYMAYEELAEEEASTHEFTQHEARTAIAFLREDGYACFAVNFKKADVRALLEMEKCNGVQLVAEATTDRTWTMRMVPVAISDGRATALGDERDAALCTEPCPTYCGSIEYLHVE